MIRRRKLTGTPLRASEMRDGDADPVAGPTPIVIALRVSAQNHAQEALNALAALMKGASSEHVRVSAANAILDRALGKPAPGTKAVAQDEDDDEPVTEVQWVAP